MSDVIVLSAAVHKIVLFIIVVHVVVGTTNVVVVPVLRRAGDYVGWAGSKVKKIDGFMRFRHDATVIHFNKKKKKKKAG